MRNEHKIKVLYKKKEMVLESKSIYLFDSGFNSGTYKVSDKIIKNKNFLDYIRFIKENIIDHILESLQIFAFLNFF